MIIFLAFKITAIIICVLVVIYSCIQICRTNKVYTIRTKWVLSMDSKWDKYSFDEMLKINVVKRSGSIEKLNLDKIHRILETACEGITGVSVSDIEMKAHLSFYDGITTKDINKSLIKAAADLITEQSPNYQYVAANILNYELRKDVWGGKEPPRLYDHVTKMVEDGFYTSELLTFYSEAIWDELDKYIDHDRDFDFSYIGLKEYIDKYSVRDRSLEEVSPLETPQLSYMLIAALSCLDTKSPKDIRKLYNDFSNWDISFPTLS